MLVSGRYCMLVFRPLLSCESPTMMISTAIIINSVRLITAVQTPTVNVIVRLFSMR